MLRNTKGGVTLKTLHAHIHIPPESAAGLPGFNHEINLGVGLEEVLGEDDIRTAHKTIRKKIASLYEHELLGEPVRVTLEEREEGH